MRHIQGSGLRHLETYCFCADSTSWIIFLVSGNTFLSFPRKSHLHTQIFRIMQKLFFAFLFALGILATGQAQHKKNRQVVSKSAATKEKVSTESPEVPAGPDTTKRESAKIKVKGYQAPGFPGGAGKMHEFIAENLKYPEKAKKGGLEGEVFVKVSIKKDGTISSPKVVSGLDPECDKEAVRIVGTMPKWVPGLRDDVPIEVTYTIPVRFVME